MEEKQGREKADRSLSYMTSPGGSYIGKHIKSNRRGDARHMIPLPFEIPVPVTSTNKETAKGGT